MQAVSISAATMEAEPTLKLIIQAESNTNASVN